MTIRIVFATDTSINGSDTLSKTVAATIGELRRRDFYVKLISPADLFSLPNPLAAESRLSWMSNRAIREHITSFQPRHIHIDSTGPIGIALRRFCIEHGLAFTTSIHATALESTPQRYRFPRLVRWRYRRWFHRHAARVLTTSTALRAQLATHGIYNTVIWPLGVDLTAFSPRSSVPVMKQESTLLYIGRVTGERTLEAFLRYPGYTRKFVVGNGHARAALMRKNPEVTFLGVVPEVRLREWYARADVVIFGDEAATRGDVLVEALACGTPVAAPNEPNAREIITDASLGCCHDDILLAIRAALAQGSRERCAAYAHTHSWRKSADTFIRHLVPIASWAPDGNTNFSNADDFRVGIEPPVNDATRLTRLGFSQCSAPILD